MARASSVGLADDSPATDARDRARALMTSKGGKPAALDSVGRIESNSDSVTSTDTEDSASSNPDGSPRSRSSTGPKTTITTTSLAPDAPNQNVGATSAALLGQATTVQYSGASSVSQELSKDGVLTVRPVPSRKDRKVKVKKVVSFVPRVSHFDRFHPTSQGDTFRGFYVLFWLLMGLTMIRVLYHSYLKSGEVVGVRFAKLISKDAIVLALSDAFLVGSTIICVPFVKLMQKGWIRYHYLGVTLQHLGQCAFLATAIRWTFYRHWYWVQSGFLTLHSLTMLMKVHSYLAFNGAMSEKAVQLRKKRAELDKVVVEAGGWEKVVAQAAKEKPVVEMNGEAQATSTGQQGLEQPQMLRRRRSSNNAVTSADAAIALRAGLLTPVSNNPKDPRHLVDFSDEKIWNLANDCVDLEEEMTSTGVEKVTWPNNVTYANYIDYLLVPTLVYELEYPRTASIRPLYVLEKTLATFGTFFVIYTITEHVIIPTHESAKANPLRANNPLADALDFVMPFMINYLLIFYIIFECICNGFAELTRFADRGFYEDWWNAVTWDEFARKWNKPVHQFLLRHVYASTIAAFNLSKMQATFLTFLLSACLHELVMAIVSKKFRMYLFMMQMTQLPMMALGRLPLLRKNPTLGNIFFWIGLIWGFPLLAVGYLRF